MRIGVVGPFTWFSGHFPEGWEHADDVCAVDVDEGDYRFLIHLINFRPDITLFYRPELYPSRYISQIPGMKLAFLSEPIPGMKNGEFISSSETDLRLRVYQNMLWDHFDKFFYYDSSKIESVKKLGWPINNFEPMPIDISVFQPDPLDNRPIDIFFIGKATPHRIAEMDFLRTMKVNFRWVAHGLTGKELAETFRRSKIVLNIHADGMPALEPRIFLAASCGCLVLSERVDGHLAPFEQSVVEYDGSLNYDLVWSSLERAKKNPLVSSSKLAQISTRKFLLNNFMGK